MNVDVAVVGAGIAGASVAAELAAHCRVALLEAEDTPGYHSTGRSAASWHETLGGPVVQPLTKASAGFLRDNGFLRPRVTIEVAEADTLSQLDALEARFAGTGARLRRIDADELRRLVPCANPVLLAGLVEEDCADIDVGALHSHYLSAFKRASGALLTDARVVGIERFGDRWRIDTGDRVVAIFGDGDLGTPARVHPLVEQMKADSIRFVTRGLGAVAAKEFGKISDEEPGQVHVENEERLAESIASMAKALKAN